MGLVYKPKIWMYWSKDTMYNTPFFNQLMTRTRFQLINKFLHFQNNEEPNYNANDQQRDRLHKIRDIMEMLRNKFRTVYYPSENVTVDESLILFKGRLHFKQYIRTKKSRFGIKFYELSTAEGVMLDFILYEGNLRPELIDPPGENWLQTEKISSTTRYIKKEVESRIFCSLNMTLYLVWLRMHHT